MLDPIFQGQYVDGRFNITHQIIVSTHTYVLLFTFIHICGCFHFGSKPYHFVCDFFRGFSSFASFLVHGYQSSCDSPVRNHDFYTSVKVVSL